MAINTYMIVYLMNFLGEKIIHDSSEIINIIKG